MSFIAEIKVLDPCDESINWLQSHNFPTLQDAWKACDRGDWMSWLIERRMRDKAQLERLMLACIECLELCKHLIPENIMKRAVETALSHVRGEISVELVQDAIHSVRDDWRPNTLEEIEAKDSLCGLLSFSKWPANFWSGPSLIDSIRRALDDANPTLVVRAECAKIIRKHFPNPPEL